jgi:hypothetical protein
MAKSGACGSPNQTITRPASMRAFGAVVTVNEEASDHLMDVDGLAATHRCQPHTPALPEPALEGHPLLGHNVPMSKESSGFSVPDRWPPGGAGGPVLESGTWGLVHHVRRATGFRGVSLGCPILPRRSVWSGRVRSTRGDSRGPRRCAHRWQLRRRSDWNGEASWLLLIPGPSRSGLFQWQRKSGQVDHEALAVTVAAHWTVDL